jgi:pantothenate kinase
MAAEIKFTDITGSVMVIEKTFAGNVGVTIAKDVQELIDDNYRYFEIEMNELDEFISYLQHLKKDIDINYCVPFKSNTNE